MFVPSTEGRWVNEHYERLARVVSDYDPVLELRWIPPESRTTDSDRAKPYVVWDTFSNQPCLYASELETPESILARLFMGDHTKHDVLAMLDAQEKARKALKMKEEMDQAEERREYIAWLAATKKNFIKLPGGRKVDDQLRPL